MSSTKARRASSAVTSRSRDSHSGHGSSQTAARLRSNSAAPGSQKTHGNAPAPGGVIGGLRKLQFLRRKTVDQLRVRQPLMEEGTATEGGSGAGGSVVEEFDSRGSNCNSHGKYAVGAGAATAKNMSKTPATTTAKITATTFPATAATTTINFNNNANNRNSGSGSYSFDGSSVDGSIVDGSNRAGGTLLVTTTAVHTNPNTCTYNNNLHLDGNKMADEAL